MASMVEVCNKALDALGQNPIMSIDDGNKSANLCKRNWDTVRDAVLRDGVWNFAMKRRVLAPSVNKPAWGFSNQFPIPSDCMRLVEVMGMSTGEYQLEGGAILANADVLRIRYVHRVEDPNQYDALFVEALSLRLAIAMCEPITQSNTKLSNLEARYAEVKSAAGSVDAQENPPSTFEEDDWVKARY